MNSPRYATTRHLERRAAGRCSKCRRPAIPDSTRCAICRQTGNAIRRRIYRNRKAHGVCQNCARPTTIGQSRCQDCQRRATEHARINYHKRA